MKIIDLSHEVFNGMGQRFPGPIPTIFENRRWGSEHYQAMSDCSLLQHHIGTHIDAPKHYDPDHGLALHEIPLEQLITEAVLLDLTHKQPLSEITAVDLDYALRESSETIHPGDGVLIFTGMAEKYETWVSEVWESADYARYPWLGESAAEWLIEKEIAILGTDSLAPDLSPDYRPVHQMLLRDNGVPIIENLCNLDKISQGKFTFIALPPKIVGVSGYLVRAVALEK
jgi:arylformamidase